jgi:5-methylthioribose kinase
MSVYEPLTVNTIGKRLGAVEAVRQVLGPQRARWRAQEIGDGNLNLVFRVHSPSGAAVVKQALPYVRLVGESWPLPLRRAYFEYHALIRQAQRDPGRVPVVYHFDETQAAIVMELLAPHVILRESLMSGTKHPELARHLGTFLARTAFRGSDLALDAAGRKADLGLFAANVALCGITENLVFTDPYYEAAMNRHTSPQLDAAAATLRRDVDLIVAVQHLKMIFCTRAETLVHGDLHTGSIMVSAGDSRVIDPEFAFYGPMSFDIGMLIGNFLMAYFAQTGHEASPGARDEYREWILAVIGELWHAFAAEFAALWRAERSGILYPACLFEQQGHAHGSEMGLHARLDAIWTEMLGFAGIEMHRRILGLAHIAEFERIADPAVRAPCEALAIACGRHLVLRRQQLHGPDELCAAVRYCRTGD